MEVPLKETGHQDIMKYFEVIHNRGIGEGHLPEPTYQMGQRHVGSRRVVEF